jgi:hypothetical protein
MASWTLLCSGLLEIIETKRIHGIFKSVLLTVTKWFKAQPGKKLQTPLSLIAIAVLTLSRKYCYTEDRRPGDLSQSQSKTGNRSHYLELALGYCEKGGK